MEVYKTNQIVLHIYSLYLQIESLSREENSPVFCGMKSLLLCTQEHATGPCPGSDESTPNPNILFI